MVFPLKWNCPFNEAVKLTAMFDEGNKQGLGTWGWKLKVGHLQLWFGSFEKFSPRKTSLKAPCNSGGISCMGPILRETHDFMIPKCEKSPQWRGHHCHGVFCKTELKIFLAGWFHSYGGFLGFLFKSLWFCLNHHQSSIFLGDGLIHEISYPLVI